jgi:hypothetical protein
MLNLRGAFVVVFTGKIEAHILGCKELSSYYERISIVGALKTDQFTFGGEALFALPCDESTMTGIALNYPDSEPMARELRAICARIALRQPLGGDAPPEGGLGILADHAKPKAPKGNGGAKVSVRDRMDQALPASQI